MMEDSNMYMQSQKQKALRCSECNNAFPRYDDKIKDSIYCHCFTCGKKTKFIVSLLTPEELKEYYRNKVIARKNDTKEFCERHSRLHNTVLQGNREVRKLVGDWGESGGISKPHNPRRRFKYTKTSDSQF